jgi:hypothetical protein
MSIWKKVGVAAVAALSLAGATLATATSAEARYFGHHGWRGGFGWGGPAFIGGLALGSLAAAPYYAAAYPVYGGYGGCVLERRVRYSPWGPVVRRVRVCY